MYVSDALLPFCLMKGASGVITRFFGRFRDTWRFSLQSLVIDLRSAKNGLESFVIFAEPYTRNQTNVLVDTQATNISPQ